MNSTKTELVKHYPVVKELAKNLLLGPITGRYKAECAERICNMLDYNVTEGKMQRAQLLLNSYRAVEHQKTKCCTKIITLGWCLEMVAFQLQGTFLILDDVMDGGLTRRGKACWHRLDNVGMSGVNDAVLLEQAIFSIIDHEFSKSFGREQIVQAFRLANRVTMMGQMLESLTAKKFDKFTAERYAEIVRLKTSHYSLYFPVQLALIAADRHDSFHCSKELCYSMGEYFQIQDDWLDCFMAAKVTGKVGSDIREGKCAWPIVTALPLASETQLNILMANYGIEDRKAEENVMQVFEDMKIRSVYEQLERNRREKLEHDIERYPLIHLRQVFRQFLQQLYKRVK